jgi:hypothetical protein
MIQGLIPSMGKRFFIFPSPKHPAGFDTHPSTCSLGSRHSSFGIKWLGCEIDHLPPSSAKVKNEWSHVSATPYASVVWTGSAFLSH